MHGTSAHDSGEGRGRAARAFIGRLNSACTCTHAGLPTSAYLLAYLPVDTHTPPFSPLSSHLVDSFVSTITASLTFARPCVMLTADADRTMLFRSGSGLPLPATRGMLGSYSANTWYSITPSTLNTHSTYRCTCKHLPRRMCGRICSTWHPQKGARPTKTRARLFGEARRRDKKGGGLFLLLLLYRRSVSAEPPQTRCTRTTIRAILYIMLHRRVAGRMWERAIATACIEIESSPLSA